MLYSKRLKLRKFEIEDKEFLFKLNNDKLVNEFRPKKSVSMAYCIQSIVDWREKYKDGLLNIYLVELIDSNESIGLIGLYESNEQTEIGYRFIPDYWGKGYCKESMKVLVQMFFSETNKKNIMAETHAENIRSIRFLEKNGFIEKLPPLDGRGKMFYLYHE